MPFNLGECLFAFQDYLDFHDLGTCKNYKLKFYGMLYNLGLSHVFHGKIWVIYLHKDITKVMFCSHYTPPSGTWFQFVITVMLLLAI